MGTNRDSFSRVLYLQRVTNYYLFRLLLTSAVETYNNDLGSGYWLYNVGIIQITYEILRRTVVNKIKLYSVVSKL